MTNQQQAQLLIKQLNDKNLGLVVQFMTDLLCQEQEGMTTLPQKSETEKTTATKAAETTKSTTAETQKPTSTTTKATETEPNTEGGNVLPDDGLDWSPLVPVD